MREDRVGFRGKEGSVVGESSKANEFRSCSMPIRGKRFGGGSCGKTKNVYRPFGAGKI